MSILELLLRGLIFVLMLGAGWLFIKLIMALIRAVPRVLNPRALGRATAVVEQKAKAAARSFQDGRRS